MVSYAVRGLRTSRGRRFANKSAPAQPAAPPVPSVAARYSKDSLDVDLWDFVVPPVDPLEPEMFSDPGL